MYPFSSPSDEEVAKARAMLEQRRTAGVHMDPREFTPAHHIALHQLTKEDQARAGVGTGRPEDALTAEAARRKYKDPAASAPNPVQARQAAQRESAAKAITGK